MTNEEKPGYPESRLAEIEAKLTLAEDLLETLNRTIYHQQQHIDRLERELRALRDQVEALSAATEPNAPQDELPPHYWATRGPDVAGAAISSPATGRMRRLTVIDGQTAWCRTGRLPPLSDTNGVMTESLRHAKASGKQRSRNTP